MSLGAQENVNIQQDHVVIPGAPLNDEVEFVDIHVSEIDDAPIVAHLAPDEADVEARITERVQHRINQVLQERLTETLVVSESVVVANEIKDDTIPESNKWSTWIIVSLVLLVVGSCVGGVAFWLLPDKGDQGVPVAPSSAPFDVDSLMEELKPIIAPAEEDLFPFMDPTSPQSQALAWLQDDPIIWTRGRSTRTALERYALAVLYYTTNGTSWNNYHLNRNDVCMWNDRLGDDTTDTWNGVGCSSIGGAIDDLRLPRNNLVGPVPWELTLLTDLKVIIFDFNRLSGAIPAEISKLTALKTFGATTNRLTGSLPVTFSPGMSSIDLSRNMLTGSIPESWGVSMPTLQAIDLNQNAITGSIPSTMGQLSTMTSFKSNENQLIGALPAELGQLSLLEMLSLRANLLTGSVTSELVQLTSLETLDLSGNSFVGSWNETICGMSGLSSLTADCMEVDCPCCTFCCVDDKTEACDKMAK